MKAFVTGGAGFIGRALVRRLRERGDEVRALARSAASVEVLRGFGCEITEGDLASVERLAGAMRGCDAVLWASDAKARRELGYAPRDLETGLRQTFGGG